MYILSYDDISFDLAVAVLIILILGFFLEGGGAKFTGGRCTRTSLMVNILYILEPEKASAPSDGGLCAVSAL